VDDHAHPRAAGAHAGADRVDVGIVRPDGDLRAVTGLACARLDLDDAVGDLGDLELEEPLDEPGMGAADDDLGALRGLADLDDVGLEPGAGLGPLVGHLLGLGQERFDATEVEQRVAPVALLDDAGDDVALPAGVLLVLQLALGLADALHHDLLGGLGRDAPEVGGGDVELGADRLALLVEVLGEHPDLEGGRIDGDPRVLVGVGHALVRRLERIGEGPEQRLDRDALVGSERLQGLHHLGVAHRSDLLVEPCEGTLGLGSGSRSGGVIPHSNTVRAESTTAKSRRSGEVASSSPWVSSEPRSAGGASGRIVTDSSSALTTTPRTRRAGWPGSRTFTLTVSPTAPRKCSG